MSYVNNLKMAKKIAQYTNMNGVDEITQKCYLNMDDLRNIIIGNMINPLDITIFPEDDEIITLTKDHEFLIEGENDNDIGYFYRYGEGVYKNLASLGSSGDIPIKFTSELEEVYNYVMERFNKRMRFTINKKDMEYMQKHDNWEDDEYNGGLMLPVLCNKNKHGKNTYWKIYVLDNKIHRQMRTGEDGKIRNFPEVECKGKNIGRKNETSDQEQALFEAHSMWLKKQDQNYSLFDLDAPEQVDQPPPNILPMLANKYNERKKYLAKPFAVSPKLDGVRVIARKNDSDIVMTSRLGKEFFFMDTLRSHIKSVIDDVTILDGELYSHTIPFNAISGATRAKKKPSQYDKMIEMWVFDIADPDQTYKQRMDRLKKIQKSYDKKYNKKKKFLKFVYYDEVNNDEDVQKFHDNYVNKGYEGVMCRNFEGKYRFKHRSNDLLKYKNFEDDEFKIVDAKKGTGTEEGAIVFTCESKSGKRFDVRPRGEIEKRREMFKNKDDYMGKMLTVRYQNTGIEEEDALPRFPVGIEVRDYE